jgi:hypothetical protein
MHIKFFRRPHELQSRATNFGRQSHFKIWLESHKLKKFPCLIMPISTKCQKMTITDIDDQNILLATVQNKKKTYLLIPRL